MTEVMGQLGKLFGGGGKGSGEAGSGKGTSDKSPSLFHLYTEVKSLKTAPPDPARFEIPAGYARK